VNTRADAEAPSRRPTLATVARAAGVSPMTVSNAFNRPDQLSPATRERVLAVAAELGYAGPDPAARSLRRGRSDTVGVVLTEQLPYAFTDPGTVSLLHGLTSALAEAGQALLIIPAGSDPEAKVRGAVVDALVLLHLVPSEPAVAAARSRGLPMVAAGSPRLPGMPHVGIDNAAAATAAARHLLELGHRRFGVVAMPRGLAPTAAGPVRPGIQDRVSGFRAAVEAAGAELPDRAIVEAGDHTRGAGRDAGRRLLELPARTRPTAVFAVTDVLALGVLDVAAEAGLVVPDRLSVVGFDDIAEAARSTPPLTTVAHPLFQQGREAARLVLAQLEGRRPRSPRLDTHLVVRGSTGPAAPP
jgi:DNA-binding LacI/PurR family transcriptional regulator